MQTHLPAHVNACLVLMFSQIQYAPPIAKTFSEAAVCDCMMRQRRWQKQSHEGVNTFAQGDDRVHTRRQINSHMEANVHSLYLASEWYSISVCPDNTVDPSSIDHTPPSKTQ